MKLEYLGDGSPDCPLIRLFEFSAVEVQWLRSLFESLSDGSAIDIALHEQGGFEQVNPCHLYLCARKSDKDTRAVGPGVFECVLSGMAWDSLAGLVEPFCKSHVSSCYRWLTEVGPVRLLLSCDGTW